jgi:hypothetical protein
MVHYDFFFYSLICFVKEKKREETLAFLSAVLFPQRPLLTVFIAVPLWGSIIDDNVLKAISVRLWEVLIVFN